MDFLKWIKLGASVGCVLVGGLMGFGVINTDIGAIILSVLGALGGTAAMNDHNTSKNG